MSDLTQAAQSPETLEIAAARIAALEAELATATAAVTVCNANAEAYREALERAEEALSAIWISGALKPGAMVALGNAIARARETLTTAPPPSSELASLRALLADVVRCWITEASQGDGIDEAHAAVYARAIAAVNGCTHARDLTKPCPACPPGTRFAEACVTRPPSSTRDRSNGCGSCGPVAVESASLRALVERMSTVADAAVEMFRAEGTSRLADACGALRRAVAALTPPAAPKPDAEAKCEPSCAHVHRASGFCTDCGLLLAARYAEKPAPEATGCRICFGANSCWACERVAVVRAELDKAKAVIERNEVSMRAQWNQIQTVKDHWHRTERERDAAQAELDKAKAEIATLKAQVAHE